MYQFHHSHDQNQSQQTSQRQQPPQAQRAPQAPQPQPPQPQPQEPNRRPLMNRGRLAKPLEAIVIGGGIAGPAAAMALQRIGVKVSVYEAYGQPGGPQSGSPTGGMALAPNGMHVLSQLGLAEATRRAGAVLSDACYRNAAGTLLATHPYGREDTYGQPVVAMARAALARVLAEALVDRGIPLHYHKRLVSLEERAGERVVATFADGTSAEADLVIGADGIHSKTRTLILDQAPAPEFVGVIGYGGFVSDRVVSPPDPADRQRMNMTFGRSGMFGYCKALEEPSTWMWWITLARETAPSRAELEAIPTETLRADLLRHCAGWHQPVEDFLRGSESIARVKVFDVQELPAWSRGRVVLIGDAAHAMSPNSGQGASTALEDALYLAHLLQAASATAPDLTEVFARFEQERRPRVEKINAEARRMGQQKKPIGPVAAWVRDRMFSLLMPRLAPRSFDWKFRYRVPFDADPIVCPLIRTA